MVLITDGTTIYHLDTTPPCITHVTVECWFAQAEADLLNFRSENKYFDDVNPVIQRNGWHPNNISFKCKQIAAVPMLLVYFLKEVMTLYWGGPSSTHVES